MVLLKAQRLQQLARKLGEIEERLERGGGQLPGVVEGLEEASARAGVELETARRLDADTLCRVLSPGGDPDPGRLWAVAEVLYLHGLTARAQGDEAAECRLEKARRLFARVRDLPGLPEGAPAPEERIATISDMRFPGA